MSTRKERKKQRKLKSKPKELNEEIPKARLWAIAKTMTFMPRDKSKDNKTFFDGQFGCYNLVGQKVYCTDCFWINRNCQKRRYYHDEGKPQLDERA